MKQANLSPFASKRLMSSISVLTLSILLLFASNTIELIPAEPASDYVKVNGRNIVDEFGRTINLRGFNLWGSDWGYGPDSEFMKFTPEHMQQIKNWGFNFVKLVVWWTYWLEPNQWSVGEYDEDFIGYMNWIIDMAWDAGLYSVISVRVCYDPLEMPSWAGWSTHDYVVYNQVDLGGAHGLERFCNLWRMLVDRFDDHPGVIGYNPWMYPFHMQNVPDGDERIDIYNMHVSPALNSAIREKSNKIIFWSPVDCGATAYFDEEGYHYFGTGGYGTNPPHWNKTRVPTASDDKNMVYQMIEYGDWRVKDNPEVVWDYDPQDIEQSLAFGKSFQEKYDVPMMSNEGPGLYIHNPYDPEHPANVRPIRQDRLDMLAETLGLLDDYPKNWAYWMYSGEKSGYGVLEDGFTLQESAIVPILAQHKATILEGDFDNNGVVDIFDVITLAIAFGSEPGHPNWNAIVDIVKNEVIDIFDVVKMARYFGETV